MVLLIGILQDSFCNAGIAGSGENMRFFGLRPGHLLTSFIRPMREGFLRPRDECAECGRLNLVRDLGYCGECEDLCCLNCLESCDSTVQAVGKGSAYSFSGNANVQMNFAVNIIAANIARTV